MAWHLRSIDFRPIYYSIQYWLELEIWWSRNETKHTILALAHRFFFNNTKHKTVFNRTHRNLFDSVSIWNSFGIAVALSQNEVWICAFPTKFTTHTQTPSLWISQCNHIHTDRNRGWSEKSAHIYDTNKRTGWRETVGAERLKVNWKRK